MDSFKEAQQLAKAIMSPSKIDFLTIGLVRCITESLQAIAFYVSAANFYIDFTFQPKITDWLYRIPVDPRVAIFAPSVAISDR